MFDKLEALADRHHELSEAIAQPEIIQMTAAQSGAFFYLALAAFGKLFQIFFRSFSALRQIFHSKAAASARQFLQYLIEVIYAVSPPLIQIRSRKCQQSFVNFQLINIASAGIFQQHIAQFQRFMVIVQHIYITIVQLRREHIKKSSPHRRSTNHQFHIFRSKYHRIKVLDKVAP